MHGTYGSAFAQDRWKMGNSFTLSVGARYDVEFDSDAQPGQPALRRRSRRLPEGPEQHRAARRLLLCARQRGQVGDARRVRPLLSAHGAHAADADGRERPLHRFVHRQLPAQQHRPGSSQRPLPDRSDARERALCQPGAARSLYPPGTPGAQHRHRAFRQPGSRGARGRGSTAWDTRRSSGRRSPWAWTSSTPSRGSSSCC